MKDSRWDEDEENKTAALYDFYFRAAVYVCKSGRVFPYWTGEVNLMMSSPSRDNRPCQDSRRHVYVRPVILCAFLQLCTFCIVDNGQRIRKTSPP